MTVCTDANMDTIVACARFKMLSEDDRYFLGGRELQDECMRYVSCQNEAAALSLLLAEHQAGSEIHDNVIKRAESYGEEGCFGSSETDTCTSSLAVWLAEQKGHTMVAPSKFDGLRGLAAAEDIAPGCNVITVPRTMILTAETAVQTDFGRALRAIPNLHPDSAFLLWLMVDLNDPESESAPFWSCLPQSFDTGLSYTEDDFDILRDTPSYRQCIVAIKHIEELFRNEIQPATAILLAAYPSLLQDSWFSWQAFIYVTELMYAYGLQVKQPDGTIEDAIVPFACLMNHSQYPHVVDYGRFTPSHDGSLHLTFKSFRPIRKGCQCFLSYGAKSNTHLLLFYGFVIADNANDDVPVTLEICQDERAPRVQTALQKANLPMQHRVRSKQVPLSLLQTATVLHASAEELEYLESDACSNWQQMSSAVARGAQYLHRLLLGMQDCIAKGLSKSDCHSSEDDLSKEQRYRNSCMHTLLLSQQKIVSSVLAMPQLLSCDSNNSMV